MPDDPNITIERPVWIAESCCYVCKRSWPTREDAGPSICEWPIVGEPTCLRAMCRLHVRIVQPAGATPGSPRLAFTVALCAEHAAEAIAQGGHVR